MRYKVCQKYRDSIPSFQGNRSATLVQCRFIQLGYRCVTVVTQIRFTLQSTSLCHTDWLY